MEKDGNNAKRFKHSTGATRFQYVGGTQKIYRFFYSDGTDQMKTAEELKNQ